MLAAALPLSAAERRPVLEQIDLPHPYYYREMYLPQLTSGPSAVAWSPDSKALIYSMAGSLWRQEIDSEAAQQLTAGPGYDYQPDWSPDGRWVVFARYFGGAIELHLLEVATGRTYQLSAGGAVNVEPRWSPDGTRIAFVSTSYNKRFHVFVARVKEGQLQSVQRLTGETESPLPRYYYSKHDTEISPAWSRDGAELVFVSNRGHIYGSGGFWRMKAEPGAEAREIYYEETTWKAKPEVSPDGKRLVYSSYLGRQWNQLWLLPAEGGHPFQLTYGEYDNTAPRWSPDGKRIAFISNRSGNTKLWLLDAADGAQRQLRVKQRKYLRPMAHLLVRVLDAAGKPTAARVSVTGADGLAYAPEDAWVRADDSYDPAAAGKFEAHYFHSPGTSPVTAPAGHVTVEVLKGFANRWERRELDLLPNQQLALTVRLTPLKLPGPPGWRWVNGDLHVHMNYGGAYRNTPQEMVEQAEAEDVNVVENLIVNKEQRVPDIAYAGKGLDAASKTGRLLVHDQEFHTSYWGHLGLLDLHRGLLMPDYAGYPGTAAASLYPSNAAVADMAHEQRALVGYVHPFDEPPDVHGGVSGAAGSAAAPLTNELPVDVALGKVDYIEVMGFSEHRTTADVWYRLLNLGYRLPAGAGTDAMANFASLRGPVGLNRVFMPASAGTLKLDEGFYPALRRGATFVSNGPLIWFRLGEKPPGGEVKLAAGKHEVKFSAWLRSIVPVEHLEVVCNGKVMRTLELKGGRDSGDFTGTLPISESGWCVLRAWSEKAEHPVLDLYPYATTSPVYVTVEGAPVTSPEDAAYFVAWIDRVREAVEKHTGWNSQAEKDAVMDSLEKARAVYEGKMKN
jgi:Tol biopolymer transport system component